MMRVLLAFVTTVTLLATVILGGAAVITATGLTETGGIFAAITAALLLSFILPLWVAAKIIARRQNVRPLVVTLTTLILTHLLLLGPSMALFPDAAREAVERHGTWMLPRSVEPHGQALLKRGLTLWPTRSSTTTALTDVEPPLSPRPPSDRLTSTATASATMEDTGTATLTASTALAAPPALAVPRPPQTPWNARQLFAHRADTVIMIKVQIRKKLDKGFARFMGATPDKDGYVWMDGAGSGFFVSSDGQFITNHHVLGEAGRATVTLRNGDEINGVEILVAQPEHDLVLARIPRRNLPYARITDRKVNIGEPAYAIGSPLGLSFTLTQGIVSAHRTMNQTPFLQMQTDVAPGSSGGPLFDEWGEVIGVNTAGRYPGLNLAVDAALVRKLMVAPHTPNALAPYQKGVRVAALEVQGTRITPTNHMNLIGAFQFLGRHLDTCIDALPEQAHLTLHLPEINLSSNLSPSTQTCIEEKIDGINDMVRILFQDIAEDRDAVRLMVRFEGLTTTPQTAGQLAFEVHYGDPRPLGLSTTATMTQTATVMTVHPP